MKFLLDGMVKGLARWLRFLGWDAEVFPRWEEADVQNWYRREPDRVFVSRSRSHVDAWPGETKVWLASDQPKEQLQQLHGLFYLVQPGLLLTRCSRCNQLLVSVEPQQLEGRIPERVRQSFRTFYVCPVCQRVYWQGGHVVRLIQKMQRMGLPVALNDSKHSH